MTESYFNLSGSGPQQGWANIFVSSQSTAGNYTRYRVQLQYLAKGYGSWAARNQSWSLNIGGVTRSGTFVIGSPGTADIVLFDSTIDKPHDANGNLAAFTASFAITTDHSTIGSGSTSISMSAPPRIPKGPSTPAAPTLSNVQPTSMAVTWVAPANGGSAITGYNVQYSTDSTFATGVTTLSPGNVLTTTLVGLTPGTRYYVRVRATNAYGSSAYSASANAQTLVADAPGMVVSPTASGTGATVALTPPGGASGVTKYTVERRLQGTTTATSTDTVASPLTVSGLTPGATYEWRSSAWFDAYQSPWTAWTAVQQPNPNTNPGDYFDGSSTDKTEPTTGRVMVDYSWTGTAHASTSIATSPVPTGWTAGGFVNGAAGTLHQVTGGYAGLFAARVLLTADATAAPAFNAGMASTAGHRAAVNPGGVYYGSVWVYLSRSQRLRPRLYFYNGAGVQSSVVEGPDTVVAAGVWTRLVVSGSADATAASAFVRVTDVAGDGWTAWLSGDWMLLDAAMVTLTNPFPYFDGDTPDSVDFQYDWLGTANASGSSRTTLLGNVEDPLADPDCDPVPSPPRPPAVPDPCVITTGIWQRYWATIPGEEISEWLTMLPTITLRTTEEVRQVRIRIYPNPFQYAASEIDLANYCSEMIVSYIPAQTLFTIDSAVHRAWAEVLGQQSRPADHLLYGTGGTPATWPELSCGIDYLISFDVPTNNAAPSVGLSLTTRT